MQKENGITIVTLAITIIIIVFIAGITVSTGLNAYENAKVSGFVSQMGIIQERVNTAYVKIKNGEKDINDFGVPLQNADSKIQEKANIILSGRSDIDDFRYLNNDNIKNQLEVSNIKQSVIVNFEKREVYSLEGIKYQGQTYYSQYNFTAGQENISVSEFIIQAPTYEIEKLNKGQVVTLNIKNIVYSSNINGGKLYYAEVTDDANVNTESDGTVSEDTIQNLNVNFWQEFSGNSVDINKSGKYAIKLVDKVGNQTIKVIEVLLVNEPDLKEGMIPVIYNETIGKWRKLSTEELGTWYDYFRK